MSRATVLSILCLVIGWFWCLGTFSAHADDFFDEDLFPDDTEQQVEQTARTSSQIGVPDRLVDSYHRTDNAEKQGPSTEAAPVEIIRERYLDGAVKIERSVSQDKNHDYFNQGSWTMWDPEGKLLAKGEYRYGKRDGKWLYLHPNGLKQWEGEFELGQRVGRHTWWYTNGQPEAHGGFVHGKREGRWIWWHQNGQKQIEGAFAAGVQTGTWISWQENGRVKNVNATTSQAEMIETEPVAQLQEPSPRKIVRVRQAGSKRAPRTPIKQLGFLNDQFRRLFGR